MPRGSLFAPSAASGGAGAGKPGFLADAGRGRRLRIRARGLDGAPARADAWFLPRGGGPSRALVPDGWTPGPPGAERVAAARPGAARRSLPYKEGLAALRSVWLHFLQRAGRRGAAETPALLQRVQILLNHRIFPGMPDTCERPTWVGGPVTLNVGGKFYSTTLETLTRFPDSMLGAMFRGPRPALTDSSGNYFIDRDGKTFRHILNFLRFGRLDLPEGYTELSLLRVEADFYQIRPLLEELRRVEAERRRQRANAVLHADVDFRERLLHFNVRRGPQNYELCMCSLRIFTANVFCTDPYFLTMLRRHLGQLDCTNEGLEEGHSGRWFGEESRRFLGPLGDSDATMQESRNSLNWDAINANRESRKRPEQDFRTNGKLRICPYDSADEEAEMVEETWEESLGLSHTWTKARHHLCLEWAPRPPELPATEYAKQKLCPLQVGGREIQTANEFLEEVLKAALAQGFRVDSVFPEPADILSAHSLRFVRH